MRCLGQERNRGFCNEGLPIQANENLKLRFCPNLRILRSFAVLRRFSLATLAQRSGSLRMTNGGETRDAEHYGHASATASSGIASASSSACADATSSSSRVNTASTDVPSWRASTCNISR